MNKIGIIKAACMAGISGKEAEFKILLAAENIKKAERKLKIARLELMIAKTELEILKFAK